MTKTRLIPALGPSGAAALQKRLTEKTMATARKAMVRVGTRLVFCHDGGNEKQMRQWLGGRHIRYVPQATGDLGRRMHRAIKSAVEDGARKVVLIGTDIPGITTAILEQAFAALNRRDLVLGPSTDGGYWLVGLNRVENIFETLMDRRTGLGAFRFETDINTPAMRRIAFLTNLRAGWLNLPYGDQGLFMRKHDFDTAGGFPEVPIAEDLYLVRKMARKGRIALAPASAVTSGRRWQYMGPMRTTIINTIIAAGCLAGVSPSRLAPLYRLPAKKTKP